MLKIDKKQEELDHGDSSRYELSHDKVKLNFIDEEEAIKPE